MKYIKILLSLCVFCLYFQTSAEYYYSLWNTKISSEQLELRLEKIINQKYLDPRDKMNYIYRFVEKTENFNTPQWKWLHTIFSHLWEQYSQEVLENKRNTQLIILEWWNIFDIDTYLTQRSLIKKWEYISYVENRDKIIALSEFFDFLDEQETLEWYLYPDTYKISPLNFKVNNFVILKLNTFEQKVYNKLFMDEVTKEPLYSNAIIESVVNLASIVEKEEKNKSEQKTVAGILKKRLKEFRHIWADITVCYHYRLTSKDCRFAVSKYIKIKTPYNTRTTLGLPPTPINNPSYTTIDNTLNSLESEYYYYLHDSNGKIYYWKNYQEHKNNIEKYLH